VLDDVWPNDEGKVEMRQLEPGPNCSVLYTSRMKSLPGLSSELRAQVESFTEPEAEELFHLYLDKDFGADEVTRNREALLGFARRVEMLPIAVAVGASLLREKSASALGRAVLKLPLDALTDGSKDVNALFRTAIASQPDREQRLLAACAVCVQEGFWLPLAAQIAELSEDDAEDAADRLVHSSLLRLSDRERRRFQSHALLRDQVRVRQGDGLSKLQERHAAALEKLFKDWETRWQDCRECLEEIIPASGFLRLRGENGRDWQLALRGYSLGKRVGELDVALRIMKQEESLSAGRNDPEAKNTLQASYGNQALILKDWAAPEEALALHKKQEAICGELDNKNGLQLSYAGQALVLRRWGRLEEAFALLKKQEAICQESGNPDGLQASYLNQGIILQRWGRLEEALALLKKQEAICQKLDNKDALAISYGSQARILKDLGRLEEGLALHKKQESICLDLGDKECLARSYGNQGQILVQQGHPKQAMELYEKQEAISLQLQNKNGLQYSYGGRALILQGWGRLDDAQALLKKQEAICLDLKSKRSLGHCYWNWGLLARAQGDRKSERDKLEGALALFTDLKMPRERDAVQAELDKLVEGA
jgi:tetratricopeptide (TPR) repeat protein